MKKSKRQKPTNVENGVDRISDLPDPILHLILSPLHSTEEVVRTSVLSTRWKYLWTSIPSLDIDISRGRALKLDKFNEFVYWVLANRTQDLDSFRLRCLDYYDMPTIGRWIHLVVMRKVKQLDLTFFVRDNDEVIDLPRCLLDCDSLEVLNLCLNRGFLDLSSFRGSWKLKILKLDRVGLFNHELAEKFILDCLLLEELSLIDCLTYDLDFLNISLPNLKTLRFNNRGLTEQERYCDELMLKCPKLVYLEYRGYMGKEFDFDVKSLKKVVIELEYTEDKDEIAISQLFSEVSKVEYLSVNYIFIQSMSLACDLFDRPEVLLPKSFPNLKTLELTINCYLVKVLIPILRSSPNLESLHLTFCKDIAPEEYEAFFVKLDEVETRTILTRHLKKVEFLEFNGEKETLAIAQFLLEHGTVLDELVFSWSNKQKYHKQSVNAMNEASKFYKASLSVKVITLLKDQ